MRQTIDIPPGTALKELTFAEPGTYPFVTHRFCDASKGALGLFKVSYEAAGELLGRRGPLRS